MAYDTPNYTVIKKQDNIELRLYEKYCIAEVEENYRDDLGFNTIFNYISGKNENSEKISMTVPVFNEMKEDKSTIAFVMPSKFSLDKLPVPLNDKIKIREIEGEYVASIGFSGSINSKRIEENKILLNNWLSENEMNPGTNYKLARYNSPFSLPILRRNEIHINIIKT